MTLPSGDDQHNSGPIQWARGGSGADAPPLAARWRPSACRAPRNVTNITNLQPLRGSFETFREYLRFEATFHSDKAKILGTGHV